MKCHVEVSVSVSGMCLLTCASRTQAVTTGSVTASTAEKGGVLVGFCVADRGNVLAVNDRAV